MRQVSTTVPDIYCVLRLCKSLSEKCFLCIITLTLIKLLIGHCLSASSICTRRPNDPCISVRWHARAPHRRRCPPARWQTPAAVRLRRGGSCHLEPHEISKTHPGLGERNPYAGPGQGELCKPQTELPSIVVLTRGSNRTSSQVLLTRGRGFVLFFHPVPAH